MELPMVMNLCLSVLIGLLLPLPAALQAQDLETSYYQKQFGPFNGSYYTSFAVLSPSSISNGALQVTPNSAGNFDLTHQSGRVMYNHSFQLWQEEDKNQGGGGSSGGKVASFNSSFLINIFRIDNSSVIGEGLAFLIAPDLDLPLNSDGGFLGLTNSTTDGNSSNGIVAIEFDTFKQSYDPDDNHVGLDIHSVISNKTVLLSDFGIQIAPVGITYYMVWVHYNGVNKSLEVFMAEQGKAKPSVPLLTSELDLKGLVNQYSYFGFAASTGNYTQLNCVFGWNLTVELLPPTIGNSANNNDKAIKIFLRFGLPGLAALLLLLIGAGYLLHYMRKKRKKPVLELELRKALKSLPNPRAFHFKDLKKATNNFDEKHKIGEGSVSVIYRAVLHSDNLQVAIKLFRDKATMGPESFLSELNIISRLRHRHLVPLLGWCYKNGMLLLVHDFMPNGSLDKYIFNGSAERNALDWHTRYKILSEVALAMHYLHNEHDQKVVHGDIKPGNIMLDSGFNARLGDFGLASLLFDDRTSISGETVRGTIGYMAPEMFHTCRVSCKTDVYGFGAVILEAVCGRRIRTEIAGFPYLADWVWWLHREGRILEAVDEKLGNHYVVEEAERLLLLGLACSHPNQNARPETQAILQILLGLMSVPEVPPLKPVFVWPATTSGAARSSGDTSSGTLSLNGSAEIVADDPVFQLAPGSNGGGTMSFEITARA